MPTEILIKIILDYLGEPDEITRALKSGRGRPNVGWCDMIQEGFKPPLLVLKIEKRARSQRPTSDFQPMSQ